MRSAETRLDEIQEEFAIENLGTTQLMADPARKSANTLQLKIKRRLLTMEMFRIETDMLDWSWHVDTE